MSADEDPATLEELRSHLHLSFPMHSWNAEEPAPDGAIMFACGCGLVSGPFPSARAGEAALETEGLAAAEGWRDYLRSWAERHRDLAPEGSKFFMLVGCGPDPEDGPQHVWREDDFPRRGVWRQGDRPQRGLAELALSRQGLLLVLNLPMATVADTLGLRVERSFGEVCDCDIAYLETEKDAFTLVHWDDSDYLEIHGHVVPVGADYGGSAERERFLTLAGLSWEVVHFPSRSRRA
jgi:hypothetical protein